MDDTTEGMDAARLTSSYSFQFESFRFLGEATNDVVVVCNIYLCVEDDADAMCADPVSLACCLLSLNVCNKILSLQMPYKKRKPSNSILQMHLI